MDKKEKRLSLLFVIMLPFFAASQICDSSGKKFPQKAGQWFVCDSVYRISRFEDVESNFLARDSSLARKIIEQGVKTEDFGSFFNTNGIPITVISTDEFKHLPIDTLVLTIEEVKTKAELDTLYAKISRLASQGKSMKSTNREMLKPKFEKLRSKIWSAQPILFIMYPIYKLNNYQLVMYIFVSNSNHGVFRYEICRIGK